MLEPGNVVAGQYLVEGVLGSAAFSTAYKCVDLNSEEDSSGCQELVCLKVIKNTKDFFDQSLDEIKILELLRQTGKCHENFIVEMRTFFYHREHLVIVTELLRQNLFEFGKFILDSGEEPYFTITRLSFITRQCLIALNFVHGIGLVHSDVKPENILLSSYSRAQAKVIDFGSSCYLTDRQSSYIQSRSYRAPEVVLGLPYDGRIDIWSLGCVVAEMFTGEVTFQNDSIVSMLSRIEAICGPFPPHMIAQGRQSSRFFTRCGLLFEKVTHDNDGSNDSDSADSGNDDDEKRKPAHLDIFQPKRTTLAARLGFVPDLMEKFDSGKPLPRDEKRQALFCDLVRKLLTINPENRLTAAEALEHPAMLYAATLTEADVKYPSS
jgi:serine/threonine protein kinase